MIYRFSRRGSDELLMDQPLTEEQKRMVQETVPFARWWVRKYPRSERAEALAVALLALVRAAVDWREGRGAKFSSFASKYMRNALVSAYRKKVRDAAVLLQDVEDTHDPVVERAIHWVKTRGMQIAAQDQVDLAILELHLMDGTLEAMGRHTGYCASGAMKRRDKLFAKLREQAELDGESF